MNRRILRFPRGHFEDQPSVTARTRETPRATWVASKVRVKEFLAKHTPVRG